MDSIQFLLVIISAAPAFIAFLFYRIFSNAIKNSYSEFIISSDKPSRHAEIVFTELPDDQYLISIKGDIHSQPVGQYATAAFDAFFELSRKQRDGDQHE